MIKFNYISNSRSILARYKSITPNETNKSGVLCVVVFGIGTGVLCVAVSGVGTGVLCVAVSGVGTGWH